MAGSLARRRSLQKARLERFYTCSEFEEERQARNEDAVREVLMDLMDEAGGDKKSALYRRSSRSFTGRELREIDRFRKEFFLRRDSQLLSSKSLSFGAPSAPSGPWGNPSARGGETNAWDTIDASSYMVRGPNYLQNKVKVGSNEGLGELVVVDMFHTSRDIPFVSSCSAAGTVRRLRDAGETRRLLLLNFRCMPIHLVLVWAVDSMDEDNRSPSRELLERFMSSMDDEEMKTRMKIIPRPLDMPWILKRCLGETPAIIGKQIPLEFLRCGTDLEVGINVVSSPAAERILRVLSSATSKLNLELAVVLESKHAEELPEQLIGGFRVAYPDLETSRLVTP